MGVRRRDRFPFTELRSVLRDLAAPPEWVDDLKLRRHQRRIDTFLPLNGGQPCHRYGGGGSPFCDTCRLEAQ